MPRAISPSDERLLRAQALARRQGGVLSRPQLYATGLTRWEVAGELRARRWQTLSDQAIALHNGDVAPTGHLWAAVVQGGKRAHLDGASALIAEGLKRFEQPRIRVSVPRGARVRRTALYDIRQTRRWNPDDVAPSGIPRSRPPVAAVRGGLWARTQREAAYLLSATVQQGIAHPDDLGMELLRIKRHQRRIFLSVIVNDLLDGARALGELDFAKECRTRHLPKPDRQVLRQDDRQRYYLDVYWDAHSLVVEIDGIHHTWAENVVGDALRQNSLGLDADTVLRVPLLGLRLQPEAFFEQIERALALPLTA